MSAMCNFPNILCLALQQPRNSLPLLIFVCCTLFAMAGSAAELIADANAHAARPLPLSAVRLTGGPLKHAQDLDAEYLLKLEPDRMLAYFRERAGLKPKFVKGKKKVAVRFQAADGKEIAAVYGIRVIRADAQR